jgi:Raf kinase inhibitor-like YbhB/YbcL family protein
MAPTLGTGTDQNVRVPGRATVTCLTALSLLAGCGGGDKPSEPPPAAPASITLSSPGFRDGGTIPDRFTCSGEGLSPPLRWSGVPANARELTLLVEDPDAGNFVHWAALAIRPRMRAIAEGRPTAGAVEAKNGFGDHGWGGPCPPEGKGAHRYVFALYATDAPLGLGKDASPDDVHSALADHAVARGTLTARFGR